MSQTPAGPSAAVGAALRNPGLYIVAGAAVVLYFSAVFLPILGLFMGTFTPLPLFYGYAREGRIFGLTAVGTAILTVTAIYGYLGFALGAMVFWEYALAAVILGEAWRLGVPAAKAIGGTAAVVTGLAFAVVAVMAWSNGESVTAFGQRVVEEQLRESFAVYDAILSGEPQTALPPAQTEDRASAPADARMAGIAAFMAGIFPGLMLVGTLMVSWANFMVGRAILARKGPIPEAMLGLKTWHAPEWLIWPVIASGFAAFLADGWLRMAAINVLMVLGLVYFFQGLGIMSYWFEKYNAPRGLRTAVYLIIAFQQYLALVVIGLGLFDMWFDFRKLKPAPPKPE